MGLRNIQEVYIYNLITLPLKTNIKNISEGSRTVYGWYDHRSADQV